MKCWLIKSFCLSAAEQSESQRRNVKLSVIIPAYNESGNIESSLTELMMTFEGSNIDSFEIIVVNDNSSDDTCLVVQGLQEKYEGIKLVSKGPPNGFGRAIRVGLEHVTGDVVIPYMADASDDPKDVVLYYQKICEGYDCVFGSRFIKGSKVENYPKFKLVVNRLVNHLIRLLFLTRHNDLTNAFKAYRTEVVKACGPYQACHFNITLEMSLGALIRGYTIARVPINWYGRNWGSSNLHIREMGRRYLSTLLRIWAEKALISDDIIAEKINRNLQYVSGNNENTLKLEGLNKEIKILKEDIIRCQNEINEIKQRNRQ